MLLASNPDSLGTDNDRDETRDRHAAEAYAAELSGQFHHNAEVMWTANAVGDTDAHAAYVKRSRKLYRESQEVRLR